MASKTWDAIKSKFLSEDPPGFQPASRTSWRDRLKEAAYKSPSGKRIPFDYENVSTEVEKRTASFEYPGVDDSYVQDNGFGSRRFPVRAIFWGPNHDILAAGFEAALLENGPGQLEHPMYGKHSVVPFGTITRRDDLKSAANQSIIEVTFWTTMLDLYPLVKTSPRTAILASAAGFEAAVAAQLAQNARLNRTIPKANAKSTFTSHIGKASAALSAVAAVNRGALQDFRDAESAINRGIDTLIGQPLLLAQQVTNMVTAPSRANAGISDRLLAYNAFFESIRDSSAGSTSDLSQISINETNQELRKSNDFHVTDLFALDSVLGSALSTTEHTFSTKPEAIAAAETVTSQFDAVVTWRESGFDALGQVDTGEAIQALHDTVALVAAYLVEVSFTLVPERRIVLDRPRTIIDLAAELYGSVDDRLNFMIDSNNLTGSEILELPRGRVIAYYP